MRTAKRESVGWRATGSGAVPSGRNMMRDPAVAKGEMPSGIPSMKIKRRTERTRGTELGGVLVRHRGRKICPMEGSLCGQSLPGTGSSSNPRSPWRWVHKMKSNRWKWTHLGHNKHGSPPAAL